MNIHYLPFPLPSLFVFVASKKADVLPKTEKELPQSWLDRHFNFGFFGEMMVLFDWKHQSPLVGKVFSNVITYKYPNVWIQIFMKSSFSQKDSPAWVLIPHCLLGSEKIRGIPRHFLHLLLFSLIFVAVNHLDLPGEHNMHTFSPFSQLEKNQAPAPKPKFIPALSLAVGWQYVCQASTQN